MQTLSDAYDSNSLNPHIRVVQYISSYDGDMHQDTPSYISQQNISETSAPHPTIAEIATLPEPKEGHSATKATTRLMQKAWSLVQASSVTVRIHVDGGANRSLTNDKSQLIKFKNIKKYPMAGVSSDGPALICTGVGYLPWQADTGTIVLVKCYYSSDAADTIISPTDIVVNNISNYKGWGQYSNLDTATGYVEFYGRDGIENLRFTLTASNGLWFYQNNVGTEDYDVWSTYAVNGAPTIKRLSQAASFVLGHERYAHSGERKLSTVHLDLDDQLPLKKPPFFKCLSPGWTRTQDATQIKVIAKGTCVNSNTRLYRCV
jgi:hypothetical protein